MLKTTFPCKKHALSMSEDCVKNVLRPKSKGKIIVFVFFFVLLCAKSFKLWL